MTAPTAVRPLSYSMPMTVAATGLSAKHLTEAIRRGELKARRSSKDEETGEPRGKWIILAADLQAYLDTLPEG